MSGTLAGLSWLQDVIYVYKLSEYEQDCVAWNCGYKEREQKLRI